MGMGGCEVHNVATVKMGYESTAHPWEHNPNPPKRGGGMKDPCITAWANLHKAFVDLPLSASPATAVW